ncbi:MAG: hypothetical protein H0W90_04305 [Actinobacteria bacterium]|nr:hypothetical protein [Actinomycetota bacterium]
MPSPVTAASSTVGSILGSSTGQSSSLPRTAFAGSSSDLLARHRVEIAGLGAAAFLAVVIAFLVG